jgi:ribosome-associated heat shock protein Hsp15
VADFKNEGASGVGVTRRGAIPERTRRSDTRSTSQSPAGLTAAMFDAVTDSARMAATVAESARPIGGRGASPAHPIIAANITPSAGDRLRDMSSDDSVRLDKWLWASRFFKTRSLAADAIDAGKVHVNGERVKRAKEVRIGNTVDIRIGPYEHTVVVRGLSDRRGPAVEARTLYDETEESSAARAKLREQLSLLPSAFIPGSNRPTKKDRRTLNKFRGR